MPIGDRFTLLNRGRSTGTYVRDADRPRRAACSMAGGKDLIDVEPEIAALAGLGRGIAPQA